MSTIAKARHEMIRDYHYANPEANVAQIAEAMNCSPDYVRSIKSQHRLPIPAAVHYQQTREDDERILLVMRLRAAGWPWRRIAAKDGRAHGALIRQLRMIDADYAASECANA